MAQHVRMIGKASLANSPVRRIILRNQQCQFDFDEPEIRASARLALSPTDIGLIADHSNNIHRPRAAAGAGRAAKIGLGLLRSFHR